MERSISREEGKTSWCTSAPLITQTCETLLSKCEIPIIDLAHMGTERCPQKGVVKQVASKLVRALSEKGLALLVNHGIPECKLKAAYRAMDAFCDLPDEERAKYERIPSDNHGYVKPGTETFSDEVEIRHSFNITRRDGLLPDKVDGFKLAVDELSSDFTQLSTMLLTALSVGLEQSHDFLLSKHAHILGPGNSSTLRLLYYPPVGAPEPGVTRCGVHSDYGTFTLLAQDCEGGLEIQFPRGDRWTRVGHLPGAILMISGELLACWTKGQIQALRHRVIMPEHYGRGRHAVAFFVHPDDSIPIEPLDMQIAANQEPTLCRLQKKKRTVFTAYQHLQRRLRETYAS
ncbi:UPF0676 protein C1494.01 [Pseudomyrmex gracilis]|uniref:UPF0676 protein C1494.01 n=1 Tax=Pseudomyrmex gracilis TaxID=219809 RepID=UPI0009949B94|nr:UPF0676 protein C1494.01 [Pseudomyrmex gracilis]